MATVAVNDNDNKNDNNDNNTNTAAPATNTLKMSYSANNRDWTKGWKLYYWQFGGGRGQYVRVMFEFCKVKWTEALKDVGANDWAAQSKLLDTVRLSKSKNNRTAFAPPIITHNNDFVLSQTGAIVLFLADLFPNLKPSNPLELARGRQILFQVVDAVEEAHTASHPIELHQGYLTQKDAADIKIKEFCAKGGRLSKHLQVISAELYRNNNGIGWFYGNNVTFVDIYVATFMRAFGESLKIIDLDVELYQNIDEYELLRQHRTRFEALDIYQNFVKSDRCPQPDPTPSFQT